MSNSAPVAVIEYAIYVEERKKIHDELLAYWSVSHHTRSVCFCHIAYDTVRRSHIPIIREVTMAYESSDKESALSAARY